MNAYDCIITRKSIRSYSSRPIAEEAIEKILNAAIRAPSGKNGQPWRFKIIRDRSIIAGIAGLSEKSKWLKNAGCLILVWLDKNRSYHYLKDILSCGAAIQNMLLAANEMGIGSCWNGDLLEYSDLINAMFRLSDNLELMAIVSFGYSVSEMKSSSRRKLKEFIVGN